MSIGLKTLDYIHLLLNLEKIDLKGLNICCMGHLNTKPDSRAYMRENKFKVRWLISSYFKDRGANATEIDLDGGKGSALKIDLGRIINDTSLFGKFDLIIDGGTGEHIDNQDAYWTNVFNLLKVGGLSFHTLPYRYSWDVHCTWRYDIKFMDNLIKNFKYEIIDFRKCGDHYHENDPNRRQLQWCMKKTKDSRLSKLSVQPYFDPQGNIKDQRMYNRFLIPARANE